MKRGFSLIEVLVFVSVASVFFITAISVGTYTLKNMKQDEYKIRATRYAEELNEWLRGEKEKTDWATFSGITGTYCFNDPDDLDWNSPGACPSGSKLDSVFQRQISLTNPSSDRVNVNIQVSWNEGGNTFTVPLNTIYSLYQ